MWWPISLKTMGLRSSHRAQPRRIPRCRLTVETLESRDMPSYVVTDLGLLPGCVSAYAEAVNASGEVAGYDLDSSGEPHAFLWNNGSLTDLGTLGGPGSVAYGINDAGQVVGTGGTTDLDPYAGTIMHAFLWQNGVVNDLGALPDAYGSVAYDINNNGQVVGASQFDWGERAFLWQSGTMTALNPWWDSLSNSATAINDAGEVVGNAGMHSDAFAWQNGSFIGLDTYDPTWYDPGTFSRSDATAVNNSGWVVGMGARPLMPGEEITPQPPRAVVWQNGFANQILSENNFGAYDSYTTGVNDNGQVIGEAGLVSDPSYHAFLWQNGIVTDLTTQIPAADSSLQVQAINNAGQIVGTANGRALLLTPAAALSVNTVSVIEGNSGTVNAVFTVSLAGQHNSPVMVNYATVNGTATAGSDYQAASGSLTFAPGETSKTITVQVNGDRLGEQNETFVVNLSNPTNAAIATGQGVGTIIDDEPHISINSVFTYEGRKGQTTLLVFTVSLSTAYDQPVTMSFKTTDGTARASDKDFVARTGTLTFNPGETTKTITIQVIGDSKREADEYFFLDLFGNSSNSLFALSRASGWILNDD